MPALNRFKKLKALAEQSGVREVAKSPSKRPPSAQKIQRMRARSEETVAHELRRIVNLPIKYIPTEDDIDILSQHYFQAAAYNSGWRLLKEQAEALLAYNDTEGAFLPIAVGGGKTLTALLIANDAYKAGKSKILLIVPPALATQLYETDIKQWRPLTIFNTPIHCLNGLDKHKRRMLSRSGRKGLYIFTYSLLSAQDAHDVLTAISPDVIILDEAHSVSKKSARTKRFNRYVHERNPQVIPLSGTMTQKKLTDYFELARAALGQNNFLPNSATLTEEWSKVIDSTASSVSDFRNDNIPKAGPLKYVIDWARSNFPDEKFASSVVGFRKAFQKRLVTCPGVVCSSGDDLPYSLYITNTPVKNPETYPGWGRMQELLTQLEEEWLTPNGDEIEEAIHLFRWKYWIEGAGFYTERYWPEVDWMVDRRKYSSEAEAEDILKRSQEYHSRHMQYMRDLRSWIEKKSRAGLDTPMLIGNDMRLHGSDNVGPALYASWKHWKDGDFEGRIERNKRAVRVCGFKVEEAVRWAKGLPKKEGGLIWYDNDEMGDWAYERLVEEGLEPLMAKAGEQYNNLLNNPSKCKGRVIVLTINAHFQGRNLQFDRNQFYLQWPRSAARAEQSIGRQHRTGLCYDEVYVTTCHTSEFDKILFGATLNDSAYVHQSQGNKQKLIYATYSPKPEIVPYEVLLEWSGDRSLKKLDDAGEALLNRTFGA